jgi:hypothetical protein
MQQTQQTNLKCRTRAVMATAAPKPSWSDYLSSAADNSYGFLSYMNRYRSRRAQYHRDYLSPGKLNHCVQKSRPLFYFTTCDTGSHLALALT